MNTATVLSRFNEHAVNYPHNWAVVSQRERINYDELDKRSSQVAAYLQSREIGRGDRVLVQAERSVEYIVALLAVMKTGAAFVPVDRRLPQKRKDYMARQCEASLVLSTHVHDRAPLLACEVRTVQELLDMPALRSFQSVDVQPQDAIYVIFTSGTTGDPKGVIIEHHSAAELIAHHNLNLEVTRESHCTLMASVGFDMCQSEIWSAMSAGACLYIFSDEALLNTDAFLALCVEHEISHAFVPTLKVYDLVNALQPSGLSLKYVFTAGEKLHPVEVLHLPYKIVDCYGPTEATMFVTSRVVDSKRLNRPDSIGFPIGSCKVYIMDQHLNEVPAGETGELCIAGSCLARGYLGAPGLTAERFVHSDALACRIYRSGDQARLLPDGSIQFLGRQDGQVKIRGYRVELGEIEARLLKEPEIGSVAVVVEDTGSQADKRLLAFFVQRNKQAHPESVIAGIRRSLEADLPDYMLPEQYHRLEALPSNVNGKTDQHALMALLKQYRPVTLNEERFASAFDRQMASIWFELLGHGDFGPEDSFFDVGGHSLRAAELARRLSTHFNANVRVSDIYEHLNFKDLSAEVMRRCDSPEAPQARKVSEFEHDALVGVDTHIDPHFEGRQITAPQHIFLTGVTGFVGIHLLGQLLASTQADIHCPVRCEHAGVGLMRVQQISERYQVLFSEHEWARINVYAADLSEFELGMEPHTYARLTELIDVVYHSASAVNFIMPYSYMRKDNVEGLRHIIRFCAAKKTKPLMLMSTISVYSWGHRYTHKTRVNEHDSIDENLASIRHDLGYVQSKWVMETLADRAAAAGLPVMTFRLGYATCHSRTGVCASYQWWGRFIQTCLTYNAVPDLQQLLEGLTTVDYMVEAVAHISHLPQALGQKFNLIQSDLTNLDLRAFCQRVETLYGRQFQLVPYKQWVELWSHDPQSLLYPLRGMFADDMHNGESVLELYQNTYRWDCSRTKSYLEGSGIRESEFTDEVLHRYLKHLT